MEAHVNKICQISYFQLQNISRIKKCLNVSTCESIIHAFISSRLDSTNAILCGLPSHLLDKIQRVQNSAARVLCGIRKSEHITPVLKSLHWLPIRQRIIYKVALLCFKYFHDLAPKYICDMLSIYVPRRNLRSSSDKLILEVPSVKTVFGERAFSYNGPKTWNYLPFSIRSSETLDIFKAKLKTHLFTCAYK